MSKPTAYEILLEINEHFRHNNPCEPHAMFDDTRTFKAVVAEWLEYAKPKNVAAEQEKSILRCRLQVCLSAIEGSASLERTIDMPFLPVVGMVLYGISDHERDISEGRVTHVAWDVSESILIVTLERDDQADVTLENKIADWGEGWTADVYMYAAVEREAVR